jgi:hypothetical protein
MTSRSQKILGIGLLLAGIYATICVALFWAMCQPPDQFGSIMRHVPMPSMLVLPFRPLWMIARAGQLEPGDAAPDFELQTHDKSATVRLSDFRGAKPVVLVFGSYT